MWIDDDRLRTIRAASTDSETVDRLLAEVLGERLPTREIPETCPLCQQPLVVRTEAALAMRMCPSEHGAWLSADDVARLRAHATHETYAAQRRRLAFALAAIAAFALFVVRQQAGDVITAYFFPPAVHQPKPVFDWRPVAPGHPGAFADVPLKASAIDVHEELVYVVDTLTLLEEGIENRLAVDAALQRPGDTAAAFAAFEPKQRDFLVKLRAAPVPGRLATFHHHLVVAAEHQIELYRAFADRKAADPAVDLRAMLRHPALLTTNRELVAAYSLFKQLYPDLDQKTHDALYGRLCAFDII